MKELIEAHRHFYARARKIRDLWRNTKVISRTIAENLSSMSNKTRNVIYDFKINRNLTCFLITFFYRSSVFLIEKIFGKIKSKKILVFLNPIKNIKLKFSLPDGHHILIPRTAVGLIKEIYYVGFMIV